MRAGLENVFERIQMRRVSIARVSLGIVFLLAGVSKFFITNSWLGFEPAWLTELVPLGPIEFVKLAGAGETVFAVIILSGYRRRLFALLAAGYLSIITLQTALIGAWAIAIRDFGLVALALSVALAAAREKNV